MTPETTPIALGIVLLVGRWTFTGYLIVDVAGDFMKRRNPVAYARLRMLRAWWTWPFVFIGAPITIALDAHAMLTGPSFMRVLIVPVDVWIAWYAWNNRNDDDPWKRAGRRVVERVAQVGHRLVIVPVGGRQ